MDDYWNIENPNEVCMFCIENKMIETYVVVEFKLRPIHDEKLLNGPAPENSFVFKFKPKPKFA